MKNPATLLCAIVVTASCLLVGCRSPEVDDPSSTSGDVEGSASPAATTDEGSAESPAAASSDDEQAEAAAEPVEPPPPPLVEIMRRVGYTDASEADLAEFVHLPPGADGEAGSFGDGAGEARVAFVRYPNPRYARPHVTDIMERRRLLPELGEAIVSDGRYVAHVRAANRATADAVADRIADSLAWPTAASDGDGADR